MEEEEDQSQKAEETHHQISKEIQAKVDLR